MSGKTGRPPKPTALKIAAGNPGKRPLNKNEPRTPTGTPKRPDGMSRKAGYVWRELVQILSAMKCLTLADRYALGRLCELHVEYRDLTEFIQKNGTTYPRRASKPEVMIVDGEKTERYPVVGVAEWPQVWQRKALMTEIRMLEREFGLTPSARSRISIAPEHPGRGPGNFDPFFRGPPRDPFRFPDV